jgi:hypothetical protein
VSSAVLYLAIVAIWAIILLPAWIRRPHSSRSGSRAEADAEAGSATAGFATAGFASDASPVGGSDFDGDMEHESEPNHSEPASQNAGAEYGTAVPDHFDAGVQPGPRTPEPRPAAPSASRLQMMRSRRRMLAILTGLTVLTVGLAGLGMLPLWLCVPPAGMLVLYLLLLREIAMADAELARKRDHAWAAHAARQRAQERARAAWAASHPEPTAQIIDISSRVGDQLYDQYADATVRAVGD